MISRLKSLFSYNFKPNPIHLVDLHSHLLPGIDDGIKSIDQTLVLLKEFEKRGFKKVITTPHIRQEYYPNTPELIEAKLCQIRDLADKEGMIIQIEAAAEYFLDHWFSEQLENSNRLLTFGKDLLLVETSFNTQPLNLLETLFNIRSKGYQPVLAHPERYTYLYNNWNLVNEIKALGVYLQMNINSLGNFYGPEPKKMAKKLIDEKLIDFIGSDCHSMRHFEAMINTIQKSRHWKKVMNLPLKNNELL